jgi:hypothetical protein
MEGALRPGRAGTRVFEGSFQRLREVVFDVTADAVFVQIRVLTRYCPDPPTGEGAVLHASRAGCRHTEQARGTRLAPRFDLPTGSSSALALRYRTSARGKRACGRMPGSSATPDASRSASSDGSAPRL